MTGTRRQKRGEARRRQVLEATLQLLAREGPRAVTHRAVAREAGTSLRATTYYFDSREALLVEALRHYVETAIARFDALAGPLEALRDAAPGGPRLPAAPAVLDAAAEALARTVVSDLMDDRAGLVAEYELVLEIGRKPSLEADYQRWQARLEATLRGYADAFGSPDPALDARIALATLRGLEIEALARPSTTPDHADLVVVFRRLLGGMLAPLG